MNKPVFDKSNLPSRHVSVGPARAPHRSFYYAMGMTAEEIAQPFVGVATCWNEAGLFIAGPFIYSFAVV